LPEIKTDENPEIKKIREKYKKKDDNDAIFQALVVKKPKPKPKKFADQKVDS
jgi:hypothetical protein